MFGKKDRRKYHRIKAHHLIKYKIIKKKEEECHPFIRNISAGGILFYTEEYIPKDTIIEVEINFPSYQKRLKTTCRVIRVSALKSMEGFNIGAEFIDIEKDAREFINRKILGTKKKQKGLL